LTPSLKASAVPLPLIKNSAAEILWFLSHFLCFNSKISSQSGFAFSSYAYDCVYLHWKLWNVVSKSPLSCL